MNENTNEPKKTTEGAADSNENFDDDDSQYHGISEPLIIKKTFFTSVAWEGVWWLQGTINCADELSFEEISLLSNALNRAALDLLHQRNASLTNSK